MLLYAALLDAQLDNRTDMSLGNENISGNYRLAKFSNFGMPMDLMEEFLTEIRRRAEEARERSAYV